MPTLKKAADGPVATSNVARQRWRLLSRAVANFSEGKSVSLAELDSLTTVRQFCQFGLFHITELAGNGLQDDFVEQIWQHVDQSDIRLRLFLRKRLPITSCLTPKTGSTDDGNNNESSACTTNKFNNTGNICVWPSEEVLAHYVIAQATQGTLLPPSVDDGIAVCELGGGLTCLAGLAAGAILRSRLKRLLLTDGDQLACDNAARCLTANRHLIIQSSSLSESEDDARVVQLSWEDFNKQPQSKQYQLDERFHLVLCADCLFFRDSHLSLLNTLDRLLMLPQSNYSGGIALICAPSRGCSVDAFASLAKATGFDVHLSDSYDVRVSQKAATAASFVPDLHLPLMLRLTRTSSD